jgi:hypothetical protein
MSTKVDTIVPLVISFAIALPFFLLFYIVSQKPSDINIIHSYELTTIERTKIEERQYADHPRYYAILSNGETYPISRTSYHTLLPHDEVYVQTIEYLINSKVIKTETFIITKEDKEFYDSLEEY